LEVAVDIVIAVTTCTL